MESPGFDRSRGLRWEGDLEGLGGEPRLLLKVIRILQRAQETAGEERAVRQLQSLCRKHPEDPGVLAGCGEYLLSLGRFEEAADLFGELLRVRPDATSFLPVLVEAQLETGRSEEALGTAEEYRRRNAGDPAAELLVGRALFGAGRHAEAEATMRRALAAGANAAEAHWWLALLFANTGRYGECFVCLEQVDRLLPGDASVHHLWGWACRDVEDMEGAELHLRKAVELDPENGSCLRMLGQVLSVKGPGKEAEDLLRRALGVDPEDGLARLGLAHHLRGSGRLREAVAEAEKAMGSLRPEDAMPRFVLGSILIDMGRFARAAAVLREGVRLDPGNILGKSDLGKALLSLGRFREARREFRDLLRRAPDFVWAHGALAFIAASEGNAAEAASRMERVRAVDPHLAEQFEFGVDEAARTWEGSRRKSPGSRSPRRTSPSPPGFPGDEDATVGSPSEE